jgi:hypothetical protein
VVKLIGAILALNVSLVFGQDTLTVVSTSEALCYPFGMFKNYEHIKKYYPEICSQKGQFCYLKEGSSYAKLLRDDNTESLRLIYAKIHSKTIRLDNGIEIGMSKGNILGKFLKTLPDNIETVNALKVEFGTKKLWHYYLFENDVLTTIVFDTSYAGDKN